MNENMRNYMENNGRKIKFMSWLNNKIKCIKIAIKTK